MGASSNVEIIKCRITLKSSNVEIAKKIFTLKSSNVEIIKYRIYLTYHIMDTLLFHHVIFY